MSRLWCRSRTNSGYNRCSKHPLPSVWRIRCLKLDYRYRTNEGTYTGATPRSLGPSEALGAARRSPYDHNLLARLGDVQLVSWSQLLSSIRYSLPSRYRTPWQYPSLPRARREPTETGSS